MRALAEASASAKGEVIALANIRVQGGLDCSLFIIGPAAWVKSSWVRMSLGVVINAPNRVCKPGGLLKVLSKQLPKISETYQTLSQTAAPLGI